MFLINIALNKDIGWTEYTEFDVLPNHFSPREIGGAGEIEIVHQGGNCLGT